MKYIYKITGKVSLILYIFMLYQFWHLCQYGGLRRHIPMLALGYNRIGWHSGSLADFEKA